MDRYPSLWRNMEGKAKVSKASVNYRHATGRRRCGNCDMFRTATPLVGDCDLVAGVIDSQDVCSEWINVGAARAFRDEHKMRYDDPAKPKADGG